MALASLKVFMSVPTIPLVPFLFGKGIKLRWGRPPVPPYRRVQPFCTSRRNLFVVRNLIVFVQGRDTSSSPVRKGFALLNRLRKFSI